MASEVELKCKYDKCNKPYTLSEIKRIYGKESMPYLLGYCSAVCYTKDRILR